MIKLSEAEWKVMTLLWQEAPQTMMQLTNHFKETTGWSKHTVMTFLRRMEEKKAIHHEDGGRAKLKKYDLLRSCDSIIRILERMKLSVRKQRSFWRRCLTAEWT